MKDIERPQVTNQNITEVYDFYRENPVNKSFANTAHHLFSAAFRLEVSLWDESAPEYLEERLQNGSQLILAINHRTEFDQYVVAALPIQVKELKPIIGKTFIPTKTELFRNDKSTYKARRWAIDQLGAVPTYRAKNFEEGDDETRKRATELLLDVSVKRIDNGQHMAIFPEGTRNKDKPLEVQKIHRGIGEIACRTNVTDKMLILPIGIVFGDKELPDRDYPRPIKKLQQGALKFINAISPTVHMGVPLEGPFESPEQIRKSLQPAMQDSVNAAVITRSYRQ